MKTYTPETDCLLVPPSHTRVEAILAVQTVVEHARKLERERDEARRTLHDVARSIVTSNTDDPMVGLSINHDLWIRVIS